MTTLNGIISNLEANAPIPLSEIIKIEVAEYEKSETFQMVKESKLYYFNKNSEVMARRRQIPDGLGHMLTTNLLKNLKVPFGFYRKIADQKTGYLLGKPFSVSADGDGVPEKLVEDYEAFLDDVFDNRFKMQLKQVGIEAQAGVGWIHPQIVDGVLRYKRIPAENAVPIWKDDERRELQAFIYFYSVVEYSGYQKRTVKKYEWWDVQGVRYFEDDPFRGGGIHEIGIADELGLFQATPHLTVTYDDAGLKAGEPAKTEALNWDRVPFVPFRCNSWELPLLTAIKPQIDEFDSKVSEIANSIADLPILVLENYGGENASDVWKFMLENFAVFLRDGGKASFMKMDIDIDSILGYCRFLRESIFEFGRAVDTQSDRFNAAVSGAAIQKLYADLDVDANDMEAEFRASMDDLLWFADRYLQLKGLGDFTQVKVEVIFNRDIMLNESETIKDVIASSAILSEETTLANHPWVGNAKDEMARKEEEAQGAIAQQDQSMFPTLPSDPNALTTPEGVTEDGE